MTKEDEYFLASAQDKIGKCRDNYMMTRTDFLDMHRRTLLTQLCRREKDFFFGYYGGYEDAERTVCFFVPDYMLDDPSFSKFGHTGREIPFEAFKTYFESNPDDNPLSCLQMQSGGGKELSHRDYLGALTGLGVRREKAGDILVRKDGADIVILGEISDFLLANYRKAGRSELSAQLADVRMLQVPENLFRDFKDTVSSLRLDNIIASAFSLSRSKAQEAVTSGLVFVNSLQVQKTDAPVHEGDKLVLRGKGKVILLEIGGSTRKDRTFVTLRQYL
ncbi:MAG: hypothetical protein K6F52_05295 [Clostridia bacterium]|nr:hypothetical protein [Clostridia bacterium]